MKKSGLVALCLLAMVLAFNPVSASAEYGSMNKCISGCLPGVNPCSKCCDSTFGKVQGPCETSCQNALGSCNRQCTDQFEECSAQRRTDCLSSYNQCRKQCSNGFNSCDNNCGGIETNFNCPNWVDPDKQKCPYDCQVWNPASRSCVGAPMNGCK